MKWTILILNVGQTQLRHFQDNQSAFIEGKHIKNNFNFMTRMSLIIGRGADEPDL